MTLASTAEALAIFDEVIVLCRHEQATEELGDALCERAWCLTPRYNPAVSDWARPLAAYEEAESVFAKGSSAKSLSRRALSVYSQGWCLQPDNNPDGSWSRAVATYEIAARMYAAIPPARGQANTARQLGRCLLPSRNPEGDWGRAISALETAANRYHDLGDSRGELRVLEEIGHALRPDTNEHGSWPRAGSVYARVGALVPTSQPWRLAEALFAQALCRCEGDWKHAGPPERELVARAAGLLRESGDDDRADEMTSVLE